MQESVSEIGSLALEKWPQVALSMIQSEYKTIQG